MMSAFWLAYIIWGVVCRRGFGQRLSAVFGTSGLRREAARRGTVSACWAVKMEKIRLNTTASADRQSDTPPASCSLNSGSLHSVTIGSWLLRRMPITPRMVGEKEWPFWNMLCLVVLMRLDVVAAWARRMLPAPFGKQLWKEPRAPCHPDYQHGGFCGNSTGVDFRCHVG